MEKAAFDNNIQAVGNPDVILHGIYALNACDPATAGIADEDIAGQVIRTTLAFNSQILNTNTVCILELYQMTG